MENIINLIVVFVAIFGWYILLKDILDNYIYKNIENRRILQKKLLHCIALRLKASKYGCRLISPAWFAFAVKKEGSSTKPKNMAGNLSSSRQISMRQRLRKASVYAVNARQTTARPKQRSTQKLLRHVRGHYQCQNKLCR